MSLSLGSPGVSVREIDLTQGGIQGIVNITGAIAGPFERGPVNEATPVNSEAELVEIFGQPSKEDNQFEYFLTASQYLSYGGNLQIVRTSGGTLSNANASATGSEISNLLIENFDDFEDNHASDTNWYFAARTPGTHSNGVKVCTIDAFADQVLSGVSTSGVVVGTGITQATTSTFPRTDGTVGTLDGYMKGIVTGIGASSLDVKFVSHVSAANTETKLEYTPGGAYEFKANTVLAITGATGTASTTINVTRGFVGTTTATHTANDDINLYKKVTTSSLRLDQAGGQSVGTAVTGFFLNSLSGINTTTSQYLLIDNELFDPIEVYSSTNFVAIGTDTTEAGSNRGKVGTTTATHVDGSQVSIFSFNSATGIGTTTGSIDENLSTSKTSFQISGASSDDFNSGDLLQISDEIMLVGSVNVNSTATPTSSADWYDQQTLGLTNTDVTWRSIAPKPKTSEYAESRGTRNDEIHVVLVDDEGKLSGTPGSILEKHIALSKATDAVRSSNEGIYSKDYINNGSGYLYSGAYETGVPSGFTAGASSLTALDSGAGAAGQRAADVIAFHVCGRKSYTFSGGFSYSGNQDVPGYSVDLSNIVSGYENFSNEDIPIDFLLMGPSLTTRIQSQAKANKLIAIAGNRKDCIACISPHKSDVVGNANGSTDITDKIIQYYKGITHSSYAVFDTGFKYTFDRFTNKFVYVPTSGDVAGVMARTNAINFPWYSPAGSTRGALNNSIKLAYNPNQSERDRLYGEGINPIITTRGQGTILFGDKTSLGRETSAFSRINVRRLFIFVEQVISRFSRGALFEFNDSVTRSNFNNSVEPFLLDIQAKRGISNFRIICDESNNTPDVIDRNEFRADIFIQPARSTNYISLTFVASSTGISFAESTAS